MNTSANTPIEQTVLDVLKATGAIESLSYLLQCDPDWATDYLRMSTNPWTSGILPARLVELICIAINAACTNLQPTFVRRHIRAALNAGATSAEILEVLKCAAAMAIHSMSLGAPILIDEANQLGVDLRKADVDETPTPACDRMRAIGQWNEAWNPFFQVDPKWTDQFFCVGVGIYQSKVLSPKELELISIAFDASFTHMYAPGTRRHIKAALKAGATVEEIMDVLKICVSQGSTALELTVNILFEELDCFDQRVSAEQSKAI